MARNYSRDSRGRFASGGGGGGGGKKAGGSKSKSASTRAKNTARAAELKAAGTTGIGGRVKAKGFAGAKDTQKRAGGLRSEKRMMYTGKGSGPRTSASTGTIGRSMGQMRQYRKAGSSRSSGSSKTAPKSPATSTRTKNAARAADLKSKGTTAISSRVKAKGFSGGKAAQKRAGGLRNSGTVSGKGVAFTVGKGGKQSAGQKAATKGAVKAAAVAKSKAGNAGKPIARTNKSPVSAAKAKYKELSSRARKSGAIRSAAENKSAAGARRSLKSMIAKRGRK